MKPTLAIGIIARNESRDLPKLFASIKGLTDRVVLVDTGSTDNTLQIAQDVGCITSSYTDASALVDGQWQIQDFSKARNHVIGICEALATDWFAWLDADDVLVNPEAVKRSMYLQSHDCFTWLINNEWRQHRMWRTGKGVRFQFRCHEYPTLDNLRCLDSDVRVTHDGTPHPGIENSNPRNIRLLALEWQDNPTARTAFYMANTHRDGSRHAEAVEWYQRRIAFGAAWRDEWLFAILYAARCLRMLKDYDKAEKMARQGQSEAPDWAEFIMEEAHCFHERGEYAKCIAIATKALDMPIPPTVLWREPNQYRDQPARLISWSHKQLGNVGQAIEWATLANERVPGGDPSLVSLIQEWRGPPAITKKHHVIALLRPGAIGDIIMTLNLIPALRAANPDMDIWYFCAPQYAKPDALGDLIRAAGVDEVRTTYEWEALSPQCAKAINLVGYPLAEGYPEKKMRHHLLSYFAHEMDIPLIPLTGSLPALTLRLPGWPDAKSPVAYATLQTEAGWSKFKQWIPGRWTAVIDQLDFPIREIGASFGRTLSESIALFANARMHIGIDSFCNHLSWYNWEDDKGNGRKVQSVILWGSTQASAAGYPSNVNISKGLYCQPCFRENPAISRQPRGPCINPPRATYEDDTPWACMDGISVKQVVEAIRSKWDEATRR